jgi:hypothetical protein
MEANSLCFIKFIIFYKSKGIKIGDMYVQNESCLDIKTSCCKDVEKGKTFIFKGDSTEIIKEFVY